MPFGTVNDTSIYNHKNSGLVLEIKRSNKSSWHKLASPELVHKNKTTTEIQQLEQLEHIRNGWIAQGTIDYKNAEYRIGKYEDSIFHPITMNMLKDKDKDRYQATARP